MRSMTLGFVRRGRVSIAVLGALFAIGFATTPAAAAAAPAPLWQRCDGGIEDLACLLPRGVGISPVSGDLYVADQINSRIVEYTAWGELVRAFGWGVVASGPDNEPRNEIQTVTVAATEGTFKLGMGFFERSPAIPYDASAAEVQSALEDETSIQSSGSFIQPGDVAVSGPEGGPWEVEFVARRADEDVPQLEADVSGLEGGSAGVATTQPGARYEICVPSAGDVCRAGQGFYGGDLGFGSAAGQLSRPQGVAVDSAGNVYVVDFDNHRVQEFDSEGHFLRMWGKGVNTGTGANKEICTNAGPPTDVCGPGGTGAGPGQFGAWVTGSYIAIYGNKTSTATDDRVYVGDQGRIQRFNVEGEFQSEITTGLAGQKVQALAATPNNGDLFVVAQGAANVRRLSGAGAEKCTAKVEEPSAVASDGAGNLYVVEKEKFIDSDFTRPTEVRKFNSLCADQEEPFGGGELDASSGIAVGSACFTNPSKEGDVYVSNADSANSFVRAYGPQPNNLALCPKPSKPPLIRDQYALSVGSTEASLRAEIDLHFWESEYWVQYATAACIEAEGWGTSLSPSPCVSEYPAGRATLDSSADGAVKTAALQLGGLTPDTAYRFRFAAQSGGGGPVFGVGGKVGEDGGEGSFHTLPSPPAPAGGCANEAFRLGAATFLPDCRAYEMVSPVDKEGFGALAHLNSPVGIPEVRNQSDLEGGKLTFAGNARFCDAVSQPAAPQYIATRNERGEAGEGWSCHGISPPRGVIGGIQAGQGSEFRAFTADLCTGWLLNDDTSAPPLAPGGAEDDESLYVRDNCGAGADGYRTLWPAGADLQGFTPDGSEAIFRVAGMVYLDGGGSGPQPVCVLPDEASPAFGCSAGMAGNDAQRDSLSHAISTDGRRVFWTARGGGAGPIYVRENPAQPQSELAHGAAGGAGDLSSGSTEVTNISTASGAFEAGQAIAGRGIPFGATVEACSPACGPGATALTLSAAASESRSGVALEASSECTEAAKACTLAVSEAVDPGAFPPEFTTQKATFWDAAADGTAALFSFAPDGEINVSRGTDLYRFEVASRTPVLIAHDTLGVLGASEDLSRVYLVSEDVLSGVNAEERSPIEGKPNLYLYEAAAGGSFSFIATLAAADARPAATFDDPSPISVNPTGHAARVSPDGGAAAFTSVAPLTGYDNRDAESGEADKEVFHYDAASDELACVSCAESRARPTGRHLLHNTVNYWAAALIPTAEHPLYYPRNLSEDGARLFFESFEPLVLRDTDGREDVYEWEAPGKGSCSRESGRFSAAAQGCVSLISSGKDSSDSYFVDADPQGENVFFATAASLVGADPGLVDVYDARVQGGFPEPPPPPVPCEGEACQSPPAPPAAKAPASSQFSGPGDAPPHRPRCRRGSRRVVRHGKAHCVRKHRHHHHRKAGRRQRRAAR